MYIFLDESGDLGFDFTKHKTSKFFVMTLLTSKNQHSIKTINLAAHKALRKINQKLKKDFINELKGANTPINIKKYFLNKIIGDEWCLYSVIIDKEKFRMPKYINTPNHLYNHVAIHLFNKIEIDNPQSIVVVTADKCKTEREIDEFNRQIGECFYSKLSSIDNLTIKHKHSHDDKLLQAVDLFCNGLYNKYEHEDLSWYNCFSNKIYIEDWL